MLKTTLFLVAGLVGGLAIAFRLQPSPEPSVEALAAQVDGRATLEALGESLVRAPRTRENANRLDPSLPANRYRRRRRPTRSGARRAALT